MQATVHPEMEIQSLSTHQQQQQQLSSKQEEDGDLF